MLSRNLSLHKYGFTQFCSIAQQISIFLVWQSFFSSNSPTLKFGQNYFICLYFKGKLEFIDWFLNQSTQAVLL